MISIDFVSPEYGDQCQIYYDIGKGFSERNSLRATVKPDKGQFRANFHNIPGQHIKRFRIDPGTRDEKSVIRAIGLRHSFYILPFSIGLYEWTGELLTTEFKPIHHISKFELKDDLLQISSAGRDPYFFYIGNWNSVQDAIAKKGAALKKYLYLLCVILSIVIFWVPSIIKIGLNILLAIILCFNRLSDSKPILTHHITVIILFGMFSVLFFNKVLLGYFYDATSFLSIWHPWRSVVQQPYLINPIFGDQIDYKIPLLIKSFNDFSFWHSEIVFGAPFLPILSGMFSINAVDLTI